ncbi:cytochrome P450 [Planotetraspora sp. A-T 1434]|uniref:cytochrome P450 n=1 Tax=Planotetraspora sp. A-T 1434 TaxID=2979219 RepID=UPI0021C1DAF0|nr:cytochrome P450 [Planotetraspora sp. A-T 1434]MCT9932301.1 cytochrome P450 [Planotetraspora sp. A-T 1434]
MREAMPGLVTYPIVRERPFDPPDELRPLRAEAPICRMAYPDGHEGWLVTGYAAVRAVLADPRFSTRPELLHSPIPQRMAQFKMLPVPPGFFLRMDPPAHTRYRRLLTGQFTVRRMRQLEPRIEEITNGRLDAMERAGGPIDLVQSFSLPIPSLVICELLGVPYDDRVRFQRDSAVMLNLESTPDQVMSAMTDLLTYLRDLVRRKRVEPADDLLSGLVSGGELTEEEITGMALLLLIAGHETTANMLALGTFALLRNPAQLAAVRDDPAVVEDAVEELLRYLTIIHIGPVRTALEDVELDGHLIRAGESVTLSLPAANRDPERFADAEDLDVTRSAHGHLTFGHGIHQCLGQQLARTEMRVAYPALLRRFPGLRLAVPAEEVPMRSNMSIYGVHRLPVTW